MAGASICRSRPAQRWAGFTLVELLIVIAIIGILVALLLPAVQAAREAARRSQCTNQIRQIAIAMHNYSDTHSETLPAGSGFRSPSTSLWTIDVMPYMELQSLYDQLDLSQPMNQAPSRRGDSNGNIVPEVNLPDFICPSDDAASSPIFTDRITTWSSGGSAGSENRNPAVSQGLWYTASMGPTIPDICAPEFILDSSRSGEVCMGSNFGTQWIDSVTAPCHKAARTPCLDESLCVGLVCRSDKGVPFRKATDGLSNTFLVGETLPRQSRYLCLFCQRNPVTTTFIPLNTFLSDEDNQNVSEYWLTAGYKSRHPGGSSFAMGDASVRFVADTINHYTYNALGSRAGGESYSLEQ